MARNDIFDSADDFDGDEPTQTPEPQAQTPEPQPEVEAAPEATDKADDKAAKQAAADAEHLPAVEEFKAAVEAAVEAADPSTGTVNLNDLDTISSAYRAVTGGIKYKNLAKNYVDDSMKAALPAGEFIKAVSYNEIAERLRTTTPAPKATKPKVDPKVAYGERVASLQLAAELLEELATDEVEGFEIPDTSRAFEEAKAHIEWSRADEETRGEAPELGSIASQAVKAFNGRAQGRRGNAKSGGSTFTGTRRNVALHIESAFANLEPGDFLTISEIVNHRSDEYGDDHPSSGAVAARLFPGGDASRSNVSGVTPAHSAEGVKGAIKA